MLSDTKPFPRCVRAALEGSFQKPTLVLDLDHALRNFAAIQDGMGGRPLHYAVKANPDLNLLARLGHASARMDIASGGEMDLCLAAGIDGWRLSFGNTVKAERDIARTWRAGVRRFSADTLEEVAKIAEAAPGAEVVIRLAVDDSGAAYPLGRKFGCHAAQAIDLLESSLLYGLVPAGVSFHVGSQAQDPEMWRAAIRAAAGVLFAARAAGIPSYVLNIGGGFPSGSGISPAALRRHAAAINKILCDEVGELLKTLEVMVEPGRAVTAEAGAVAAEVLLSAERQGKRWVYLDVGRFSGLAETEDEFMRYPLFTHHDATPHMPCVVAGPTCDSADVLWERIPRSLPVNLQAGDRVVLAGAGAYTTSYASVGFNGFAPLDVAVIG